MSCIKCKNYLGESFGYYFCSEKGRILPELIKSCKSYKAKSKYNNSKTEVDGIKFDSKKEANRWQELLMMEKSRMITNLERQKRFQIVPKTESEQAVFYVADFVYQQGNKKVCEDVKSPATRKDKVYIIKRKLFKYLYSDYVFLES